MKKIIHKIKAFTRFLINFAIRLMLDIFYYAVLCPFFLFIRLGTDFLDLKGRRMPQWIQREKIKDVKTFLSHQ